PQSPSSTAITCVRRSSGSLFGSPFFVSVPFFAAPFRDGAFARAVLFRWGSPAAEFLSLDSSLSLEAVRINAMSSGLNSCDRSIISPLPLQLHQYKTTCRYGVLSLSL